MTQPAVPPHAVSIPPSEPCWRRIGTDGDRTCPELTTHVHCRNCPVLAEAARRFFDRPAPAGYVDAWQEILAAPANAPRGVARSVLVFRLGAEWLALPTTAVAGVALPRRPRRIPHRSDGVLAGLVAVHGQLELCLRLDRLLGVATTSAPADESAGARLLVLTWRQERWAAVVDEVGGLASVPESDLRPPPATVSGPAAGVTEALFSWREQPVGLLDPARLLDGLHGRVGG